VDEICKGPETWQTLKVTCNKVSPNVTTLIDDSSVLSFAFHLQTGETVTCEHSPCECVNFNVTAVQLLCRDLPVEYNHANLTCYLQDRPLVYVHAPVHVRGNACLAL